MSALTKKATTPRKKAASTIPMTTLVDLSAILKSLASMEASIERVIDVLTKPRLPYSQHPIQTAADIVAARLEALLSIFSGRHAQSILQDMLESGQPPSREQLLREADRFIAARGGK